MRLWSIHPKYLDTKGLLALWRETLLAQNVLLGKTKGYINHPQLNRFKATNNPTQLMASYLLGIYEEAKCRGYKFDKTKIVDDISKEKIAVTTGQIIYEKKHLLNKLQIRDHTLFDKLNSIETIELHPIFFEIEGEIEEWERV